MIPLNVKSNYTALAGVPTVGELVERAKREGARSAALADLDGMYGLIQFYKKAREAGVKPILGATIDEPNDPGTAVTFLVRNRRGYSDLCRIVTSRKLKDDFSLFNLMREPTPNLVALTPSRALLERTPPRRNVYAELVPTRRQRRAARELHQFAVQRGIPFVASNPVYFLEKEDFELHRVLTAIRTRNVVPNVPDEDLVDPDYHHRSSERLARIWRNLPEARLAAERIEREAAVDLELGKLKFPEFPLPEGETAYSYLWRLAYDGLARRYESPPRAVKDRLEYELEVICEMGYADYFLVVWDLVREAKRRGMPTVGRGSAANSLVSYCLEFTDVDPIKYDLYFERFLNRGRATPPDVDLDFSWKDRDDIVKYVFEKYGYDCVAMISTTVTFRARSAFRETAKAFGVAEEEIAEYSKYIPRTSARNLPDIASLFPETKSFKFDREPWRTIAATAARLAEYPRHLSVHPGGVVVSPTPIVDHVALEYAKNKGVGLIVTQPDMYSVEDLGLVKIDLLSQRSLGVLRDSLDQLAEEGRDKHSTPRPENINVVPR